MDFTTNYIGIHALWTTRFREFVMTHSVQMRRYVQDVSPKIQRWDILANYISSTVHQTCLKESTGGPDEARTDVKNLVFQMEAKNQNQNQNKRPN